MADNARETFNDKTLTLDGRVRRLPRNERDAVEELQRGHDDNIRQVTAEQARSRPGEINEEREKLAREDPKPELKPDFAPSQSMEGRNRQIERQARERVDQRHKDRIDELEKRKNQEVEKRVEEAEREQERKRAEKQARAAQLAREFDARRRADNERGR